MLSETVEDPYRVRGLVFRSVQNKPLTIISLKATVFYTVISWSGKSYLA